MNLKNLKYDLADGVCTITINRPDKMNALNIETISELGFAVNEADQDNDIIGIIITGEGPKAFVAGADIAEFSAFSPKEAKEMALKGHNVFDSIENCSKPVIAAVNGFALGGGCELAMACHMRIASTNAKFGQPEISLGVVPGYGGTQRLTRLVGKAKATEMLLTGDAINAEDAKSLGLVNYVVEQDQLLLKAKEILSKIAKKSPLAASKILELVNAYYEKGENGFNDEINAFSESFETSDFHEGVAAFLEKRPAAFTGK